MPASDPPNNSALISIIYNLILYTHIYEKLLNKFSSNFFLQIYVSFIVWYSFRLTKEFQ